MGLFQKIMDSDMEVQNVRNHNEMQKQRTSLSENMAELKNHKLLFALLSPILALWVLLHLTYTGLTKFYALLAREVTIGESIIDNLHNDYL